MTLSSFTPFDFIVLAVMLVSVVTAFFRGFAKELFLLLALIGATIISIHFSDVLQKPLAQWIKHQGALSAISKGATFFIATIILGIIGRILAGSIKHFIPWIVDHSLGVLFGFARGAIFVLLPYLLFTSIVQPAHMPGWIAKATTKPALDMFASSMRDIFPPDFLPNKGAGLDTLGLNGPVIKPDSNEPPAQNPAPAKETEKPAAYNNENREKLDLLIKKTHE